MSGGSELRFLVKRQCSGILWENFGVWKGFLDPQMRDMENTAVRFLSLCDQCYNASFVSLYFLIFSDALLRKLINI